VRLLPLAVAALAGTGGVTVGISNRLVGARPVALTLRFTSVLQCGQPIGPPITVVFPAREVVPRRIPTTAVTVNGGAPSSVTVSGRMVTLRIPRPEVVCDVIGPGRIAITFARAAKLGNPARIGTYRVLVHRGTQDVTGTFSVHT
jgi:hypothetical protein